MHNRTKLIVKTYQKGQKEPTSHSFTELNKLQFFPEVPLNLQLC